MIDFVPAVQTILTVLGIAGVVGIFFVAFRSRLPQETIKLQDENIHALQEAHKTNSAQIKTLEDKVTKLEAENNLLKDLPLQQIADTQEKVLDLLKTQNRILESMSLASPTQVNVSK